MEQLVQQLAGLQQEDRPDDYINDFVEGSEAESSHQPSFSSLQINVACADLSAALDTSSSISRSQQAPQVQAAAQSLLALLRRPPDYLYAQLGGVPSAPPPGCAGAAAAHTAALLHGLALLHTAVQHLNPHTVDLKPNSRPGGSNISCQDRSDLAASGCSQSSCNTGKATHSSQSSAKNLQRPQTSPAVQAPSPAPHHYSSAGVTIEELPDASDEAEPITHTRTTSNNSSSSGSSPPLPPPSQQSLQTLSDSILLLCTLYSSCSSSAVGVRSGLTVPWVSTATHKHSHALLLSLSQWQHPSSSPSSGSSAAAADDQSHSSRKGGSGSDKSRDPDQAGGDSLGGVSDICNPSVQHLLLQALPRLVGKLKECLVVAGAPDLQKAPSPAKSGPGAFERACAARQLACLASQLTHPAMSDAVRYLLPALLSVIDDPAAAVSRYGLVAMCHLVKESLPSELRWQRELLLHTACQMVVGCQDELWQWAVPAAVAIVVAMEGSNPRSAAYHTLASELLTEIERNAHLASRRVLFCREFPALLRCLGLTCVRHTARLLPLLLEWLSTAHDTDSRLAALDVLHAWLLASWPRVPAHAALLQRQLSSARTTASVIGGCGAATVDGKLGGQKGAGVGTRGEEESARSACLLQRIDEVSILLASIDDGAACWEIRAQPSGPLPSKLCT